ncbi:hypothetical protein GYMLUDRAFT_35679 [Collybiopsis luxurians FD-317 M1]|nr:hypothetical protein GYMLUDRAFT_35679 [Collybiopsis luxurians FD-317 M1]
MLNENYRLKEHGKNTLGIRLVRLSPNDIPNMKEIDLSKSGLPIAKWEEWGIPGWPAGKPASEFSRKE